jgi:hypothetical protein
MLTRINSDKVIVTVTFGCLPTYHVSLLHMFHATHLLEFSVTTRLDLTHTLALVFYKENGGPHFFLYESIRKNVVVTKSITGQQPNMSL